MIFPVLNATLSVFLLIVAGGFLRWVGCLRKEADGSLMSLCINVLYPCLIFDKISQTDILAHWETMWAAPLAGYLSVLLTLLMANVFTWLPRRITGLQSAEECRTFACATSLYNYGYLPIPILLLLYPNDPEIMSMLFVFVLGVELAVWTCAVPCLAGGFHRGWWKNMLTVPFITILVSAGLNILGILPWIPGTICQTIQWVGLGQISIPLLIIGAIIYDQLLESRELRRWETLPVIGWILFFRSVFFPFVMILAALGLSNYPLLQKILIIQAAMPSAMMIVMFTRIFGGSPVTAVQAVLSTNFFTPVTTVFWITIGMWLLASR